MTITVEQDQAALAAGVPMAQATTIIMQPAPVQPAPAPVQPTPAMVDTPAVAVAPVAAQPVAPITPPQIIQPVQAAPKAPLPTQTQAPLTGINSLDFIAANRIHVKDGSLFVDPYLALHPRELDPANEGALRKKLQLTYSINNPTFFDSPKRMAVALNLGQLLPVSIDAKRSQLMQEIDKFNREAQTGQDTDLEDALARKMAPFGSIVQRATQDQSMDPVGMELLKNSLTMYLLVREKLTQQGYLGKLTDYVVRSGTPDQVMADLAPKIGITPLAMREAALRGGIDGVANYLGIDPEYVAQAKAVAEYASGQDFSYNIIEHWHLGRQIQGLNAPMEEKIAVGMDARITAKIAEYRDKARYQFDVPGPAKQVQLLVAQGLDLVAPVQRALMFKLGYEFCYTPEYTADKIAFYPGIFGLHRKAANDMRDAQGTYRIYFSGHGDLKASMRTLVHEVAHNLWPDQFSPQEAGRVDTLIQSDAQRFAKFQHMMDNHYTAFETLFNAYKTASDPGQKQAMIATANKHFAAYGLQAEGLFPYLRDAHDFKFAVKHVYDTLSIEGDRYNKSGYHGPEERLREVISRFTELKQVEYRGDPQFLQFLAPGLNQVFETHYLPHLQRVLTGIENGTISAIHEPQMAAEEFPKVKEQPKVEQRPVMPQPVQASAPDTSPMSVVATDGLVNSRMLSAMNALSTMGAQPQF